MELREITIKELREWEREGRPFRLVDVRERIEHEEFNMGGLLLPLSEINRKSMNWSPGLAIIVYCKKGIRSRIAIQRWSSKFPGVTFYNLTGGLSSNNN